MTIVENMNVKYKKYVKTRYMAKLSVSPPAASLQSRTTECRAPPGILLF